MIFGSSYLSKTIASKQSGFIQIGLLTTSMLARSSVRIGILQMIHTADAMNFVVERSYVHSHGSVQRNADASRYFADNANALVVLQDSQCKHNDTEVFYAQDICIKTVVNYSYEQDLWEKVTCNGTHVIFASYSDSGCAKPLSGPLYPQPMELPAHKCHPYGNVSSNESFATYATYNCDVEFRAVVKEVGNDGTFKYTPADHCMKTAFRKHARFSCEYCKATQTVYGTGDENCSEAADHNQTPHWGDTWTCCEDSVPEAKEAILQDRTFYDKLRARRPPAWIGCLTLAALCVVLRVVLALRAGRGRDSAVGAGDSEALFPQ